MMTMVDGLDAWAQSALDGHPTSVALGIFDGVHVGHQALLNRAVACAKRDGLKSVAFTFDPHPARVFRPEFAPRLIEPVEARAERMGALGLDAVLVQPFDRAFAATPAETFVTKVLQDRLQARHVIVGRDFVFGHKQQGNVALLEALSARCGYTLHALDPVRVQGMVASSTKIRELLRRGALDGATEILGRRYRMWLEPTVPEPPPSEGNVPWLRRTAKSEQSLAPGLYAGIADAETHRTPVMVHVAHASDADDEAMGIFVHVLESTAHQASQVTTIDFVTRLHAPPEATAAASSLERIS